MKRRRVRARRSTDQPVDRVALGLEATLPPWTAALVTCLPPLHRSVFVLHEAGWTKQRIADHLAITSVRVHLLRARAIVILSAAARRAAALANAVGTASERGDWTSEGTRARALLELDVSVLGTSVRTHNALTAASITTLGQLIRQSRERVCALQGMGPKGCEEIEVALARLGLALACR